MQSSIVFIFALLPLSASIGLAPGLYCGLENCYDVLQITRDDFNKNDLARIYRRLALKYHPDRVSDQLQKTEAEEKFRQIATAYETLKDEETRTDYDYYLDHPEERYYNYYQYYRRRVAPKVDVRIVIIVTVILISGFQFLSSRHKYHEALEYAVKQEKYRNGAREIARERGLLPCETNKKDKKWRKELEETILRQIIEENMDIRGGYSKPSIYDTFAWNIICFPVRFLRSLFWQSRWIFKYWIKREEYDEEDKFYLIRKYMDISDSQFTCLDEEERISFLDNELWKKEKFEEWKRVRDEEQKEKLANSGRYKRYRRYMKNQAGNTISFLDE